ncbi:MAG: CehA/McbA family metallohydrolase [Alphaproteobacteria bacterium]|nr:CehA/McbA family metallohydrolase [Alphaproteobacteria bacterium]MCB9792755.1 CehA/McbA family metallohydrolase [Alphaproteobacteria bacterium]
MLLILLLACHDKGDSVPYEAPDLTAPLGPDEARAAEITDEAALFGGGSAEGQLGDFMLINSEVRFVVQSARLGGYAMMRGGAVIDADIVRPEGQPGRDLIDDWAGMIGLGQVLNPDQVELMDDGVESGVAWVRATGGVVPLAYLTGAVENDDIVPELDVQVVVDYRLPAGSHLMEVTTTLNSEDEELLIVGDLLIAGHELTESWTPGLGLDSPSTGSLSWLGAQSTLDDGAAGVFSAPGHPLELPSSFSALASLLEAPSAFAEGTQALGPDSEIVHVRYYGVGESLAQLTDAWMQANGAASEPFEGVVEAPDGPVEGARVNILVDGAPWTLARSGADGSFSVQVPAGASVSALASGRGPGTYVDVAEGAAPYSPYTAEPAREQTLASYGGGATPVLQARGRGVASVEDPLFLGEPAFLHVTTADGGPAELRLSFAEGDPVAADARLSPGRPSGYAALAWLADGDMTLAVEPGQYSALVHRGPRHELQVEAVELRAGETTELAVTLTPAFDHGGWLLADPHSHSAPSNDGEVRMDERLLIQASVGIQLHFGTEHDHIVNFSPLVEALGIEDHLRSVTACEVSPVLRGHLNQYPLTSDPQQPNGGAWPWYADRVQSTEEQMGILREMFPGTIIQANHPLDSGIGQAANWSVGRIGEPDFWSEDLDAMEVLNGGNPQEFLPFFFDLINRGVILTPTGVSDAHGHLSASQGARGTWIHFGSDDPAAYTPEGLVTAMQAGRTIVSKGVFLDMDIQPGTTLTAPDTVTVEALSASWVGVDRLQLWRDGALVEELEGSTATFTLEADEDASFVIMAEGDAPMSPVYGDTPWAMSAPIYLDLGGDGWEPPLPPLTLE